MMRRFIMTQCMSAIGLQTDDTISHADGLHLEQGLSSEEVHKRALASRKLYGKAQKALTFWIVEMDERELYKDFGCSNIFQYATRYLSLAERTIAEMLRTGRALAQLPLLSEAFEKGQISSSHVREISRVATAETEQFWYDTARAKTVREVEKLVAFTPRGGLPLMRNTPLQSPHGKTPAIPTAPTILLTPEPASEDVLKCASEGETLEEQSTASEMPPPQQGLVKYHEKLVVDLNAEEMSVLKDALDKARKESGKRDRASLLLYIAKSFLEGCPSSGKKRKPSYQIVIHRHLPSDLTWCNTPKGERPVSHEVLEKALIDAEIVELDEPDSSPREQNIEKDTNSREMTENTNRQKVDIQKEAHEYVNEQYMKIKAAKKEKHKYHKGSHKSVNKKGRSIPTALRKKVLLRDGCTCQAPGCGKKVYLSVHHLIAFAICGIHNISSMVTLCTGCHALVHEGKLSVEGVAPHGLIWRDGKGCPI